MKFFLTRLLMLLCLLSVLCNAYPEDSQDALLSSANGGDHTAQKKLGDYYSQSRKPEDLGKEIYWYEKSTGDYQENLVMSAEKGSLVSQRKLADYYCSKEPQDLINAVYWYEKSGNQGDAGAQKFLSRLYFNGAGSSFSKDFNKAFYWAEKSAWQGDVVAQDFLAWMYRNGKGTPRDFGKAFYWVEKRAAQNDIRSQYALAAMYLKGEGVTRDWRKAFEIMQYSFREFSRLGLAAVINPVAMCIAGIVFCFGVIIFGVVMSYSAAVRVLENQTKGMSVEERPQFLRHGALSDQMVCVHCQQRGSVRTKVIVKNAGISGAKVTAAIFTCGLSLFVTGLSRKEPATKAYCTNCFQTWTFC